MATERETQLLLAAYQSGVTSREELANFMAQVSVESGGLSRLNEGFVYSRGIRQITVDAGVRSALREGPEALEAARVEAVRGRPQQLAELMYGGRMGNNEPGDGYKYHGRGYIQLTGKNQYRAAGEALGLDLVNQPELAAQPEHAAKIAILYWKANVLTGDRDNVIRAGGQINTGDPNLRPTHADRREAKFEEWSATLTPEIMERLALGEVAVPVASESRPVSDPAITTLQQNLNALDIRDARGQSLMADGDRGARTNEAVTSFQRQLGLEGQSLNNNDLLLATRTVLDTRRALDADQALRGMLPENARSADMTGGVPAYLVPGRTIQTQGASAAQTTPARQAADPADSAPAVPRTTAEPQPAESSLPLPTTQTLEPGDRGAAVQALQQHLRSIGANDRNGQAIRDDRDYGPRTREAVEQFQLWTGRETTGIADPDTLNALQEHARYADRHRAQGIRPGDHLADNLNPDGPVAPATTVRHALQGQGASDATPATAPAPVALVPYNDPKHPKHDLYSEVKTTLEGMGHHFPEDRLHQIVGKMDMSGLRPGSQNRYAVRDDNNTFYVASDIPGFRAHQRLDEPAAPINDTMQDVQAHQQTLEMSHAQNDPSRSGPMR